MELPWLLKLLRRATVLLCLAGGAGAWADSTLPSCPWLARKDNCVGEETQPNGRVYSGEFRAGRPHGQGTLSGKDGYRYVGGFAQGLFEGHGELRIPPGWAYVGEFSLGRFSGKGDLRNPDGKHYVGEFRSDNYHGEGILRYPDGTRYEGRFMDDQYHGAGTEFNADGTVRRSGDWEFGRLQEAAPAPALAAGGSVARPALPAQVADDAGIVPQKYSATALVIGNSDYQSFSRLPNPRNDARAIAAKLRSFGITVDLVLDAGRETLVTALNDYQRKAAGRDVNLFFYAGHGVQVNGVNYLIPTDMRMDGISAGYIKLNGVSVNDALDYFPARTRLVFLDACRDNPATRSLLAHRSLSSRGLAPIDAPSGTLISFATKDGSVAEDGSGANSPFTTALLEFLDVRQDISIVLRKVRQRVLELTAGQQEPWEYGSLTGDQLILSTMLR